MKRFRVGTLMLFIAVVGLGIALIIQHDRCMQNEVALRIMRARAAELDIRHERDTIEISDLRRRK